MKNIDQLFEQMERDELQESKFLTPRDVAKVVGVAPQLVYYYVRTGKLEMQTCDCGRKVVSVKDAIDFFAARKK